MADEVYPFSQLDKEILANGPVALYFNQQVLEEAKQWFLHQNYEIMTFDCNTWVSQENFHSDVSQTFGFSEYYGRNLDAFNDFLSEAIFRDEKQGTVLVFLGFDTFAKRFPQFAWHVLDIIAKHSYDFLLAPYTFTLIALVQSNDPTVLFQPVGARPVIWNRREWSDMSRGL